MTTGHRLFCKESLRFHTRPCRQKAPYLCTSEAVIELPANLIIFDRGTFWVLPLTQDSSKGVQWKQGVVVYIIS